MEILKCSVLKQKNKNKIHILQAVLILLYRDYGKKKSNQGLVYADPEKVVFAEENTHLYEVGGNIGLYVIDYSHTTRPDNVAFVNIAYYKGYNKLGHYTI